MDGEALNYIQDSVRREAQQITIGQQVFSTKDLKPIIHDPHPHALGVGTLTGIRDFMAANVDKLVPADMILHVMDERSVQLIAKIDGPYKIRDGYLLAKAEEPSFRFGDWMDPESFVIGIQTQFLQDAATAALLKVVGNIGNGATRTNVDDGVSQTVSAKVGVQLAVVDLPSPIALAPYRTFREVVQPPSIFILRARAGSETEHPKLALFLADGNRWRLDAIRLVADWLRANVPGMSVLA